MTKTLAKGVLFQKEIDNPLAEITDWPEHEKLVVGVHTAYTFNYTRVEKPIEILQLDDMDISDGSAEDFRDYATSQTIITTAQGARKLAQLLIEAADLVEGKAA